MDFTEIKEVYAFGDRDEGKCLFQTERGAFCRDVKPTYNLKTLTLLCICSKGQANIAPSSTMESIHMT